MEGVECWILFIQALCGQHLAEEEMSRAVVFVQANDIIDWYNL
jgi:hypothetical protein